MPPPVANAMIERNCEICSAPLIKGKTESAGAYQRKRTCAGKCAGLFMANQAAEAKRKDTAQREGPINLLAAMRGWKQLSTEV